MTNKLLYYKFYLVQLFSYSRPNYWLLEIKIIFYKDKSYSIYNDILKLTAIVFNRTDVIN